MVKLASSYDNLLNLNTEIEQAAQQPDQFHTADTHYDVVSETLPAVDDPSDIKISEVEKTLNRIDQIQKESAKAQLEPVDFQQDTENDADDQPEISDNPADALNKNRTTTLESVFGNVNNQRSAQSDDDGADQNNDHQQDDAMDRIRTQFNHHAKEPTTPVNRDVETLGHGIDQQKVTPISQPKIDRSAGNKSLTMGTQSLSMLNDEDFDRQVDQLTQGIEREAEELAPSQAKLIIDGIDLTDDLPATITGTYSINRNDDQNITITKTKELPEIPDTSAFEQQISDLQQELAHSNSRAEQLQADKKQLVLQVQQLQSQIAQAASESTANNDQQTDDHMQMQNSQTINHQQVSTPAAELSTALTKIRQHLSDDVSPIEQVEQINNPSAEFKLISNHALKSSSDRGAVIQQLMGSKPDSEFNQALQNADQIAVQVKTAQADIKPSLGSLSLLALTQARSQINVQFSQKDRKNTA